MTIQVFSIQTGIPKSTLRFYEEKHLLKSVREESSNYRMYAEDQIPLAKLIASLRAAKVPIRDIQLYLEANENSRKQMKKKWIQTIKENQRQLEVSLRYLESDNEKEEIYMFEKTGEKVIWFEAESAAGQFSREFVFRREQMKQHYIPINNMYLRYISGNRNQVKAEIGFGVSREINTALFPDAFSEKMRGSFCVGLPFNEDFSKIERAYRSLMDYCVTNSWTPAGSILEWYRGDQMETADIIMPVSYIGAKQ
ncbi:MULTISPECIES: MerR family transcriptional regulator [Oceanobacillus]|uniref:MerR family regulatory protein n=2 Tax=Oceanobacillus TaxID=182709 RepID=A0A0A1MJF9_9BACI|nr:MerR family transcriptional regulator [Oceanobacillus oncorhynchi]MDM8101831.1 MerR family transcriptional regulator [Oceanobacillus oncorhynchi]UUI42201.1 MerR family transcriptional regulator [Oceanobacillus oncorhynchi]CEI83223.1 MerR family regulatory protein [Oceanobacillus oncorhynchi]